MGSKKHKKHHRSEKKEAKDSSKVDKPGLKLVLKVGGSNVPKPSSPPKAAPPVDHHVHHHHHHHHGGTKASTSETLSQIKEEVEKGVEGHPPHEKHKKNKKKKKKKSSDREKKRHKHHHHHHHHREHNHDRKEKRRREHDHLGGIGDGFPPPPKRPLLDPDLLLPLNSNRDDQRSLKRKSNKTPLQTLLHYLLRGLQKKDPQLFFAWPVSDMIAPGYSSIITHPMDFSSMKQKIENKEYSTLQEFRMDLRLMCDNAMTYNRDDTIYHKAAKKMWHSGQKLFHREQVLTLARNLPSILEITPEELGFDIGEDAEELRAFQAEEMDIDLPMLSHSPDSLASRRLKHKAIFHSALSDSDDIEADDILNSARKAARAASERLTLQKPNCRFGFLRQRGDGSTSLAILNPVGGAELGPEDIPVNLEMLVGKLSHGSGSIAGFKEDPKNLVRPVKSLNYGSFSSYAPQYDSMFSNLSKDESDLVLSTYGDELGVQYAESLLGFAKDCDYVMSMVDTMLDTLTSGSHTRTVKQIYERKGKEDHSHKQQPQPTTKTDTASKDSTMDLSELDIDMEFLNEGDGSSRDGKGEDEEEGDKETLIQGKLDETSSLLQDLAQVQRQRLSAPPPSHLSSVQGPNNAEVHLADKVTRGLTDLAMQATPSAVSSLKGVRKAMGITYETVHCNPSTAAAAAVAALRDPSARAGLMGDQDLIAGPHKIDEDPLILETLTSQEIIKTGNQQHLGSCDLTIFLDNTSSVLNI